MTEEEIKIKSKQLTNKIESKERKYNILSNQIKLYQRDAKKLEKEINDIREERKNLFSNNKLPFFS